MLAACSPTQQDFDRACHCIMYSSARAALQGMDAELLDLETTVKRPPHLDALDDRKELFHTRTPWLARQLAEGKHIPAPILSKILVNRQISAHALSLWVDILARKDLYEATERLQLLESAGEGREMFEHPHWLFLSLPAMLQTAEQAPYLASLLGSARYDQLDLDRQGLFVARCIQHFLKVGHYVAVRETVDWICYHQPQLKTARFWAECLAALSSFTSEPTSLRGPPRELLASLARRLKEELMKRGVRPSLDVYRASFRPWLIPAEPLEIVRLLQEMEAAGYSPRRVVLHRAMTALARAGDEAGAAALSRRMQGSKSSTSQEAKRSEELVDGSRVTMRTGPEASTQLLALGGDVHAAFDFFNRWTQESTRRHSAGAHPPLPDKITWSILFNIISASDTVSSQDLLAALRKLEKAASVPRGQAGDSVIPPRPSLHIYHSVMLGLLRRHDPRLVVNLWVSLRARGVQPDNHILDVLIRAYCTLDDFRSALSILDHYSLRPNEHGLQPATFPHQISPSASPDSSSVPHPVEIDVVTLNNLLSHYSHAGLTHNAYRLFVKMPSLYGVQPDATSLTIIIDAARYASAAAGSGYGPGTEAIDLNSVGGQASDDLWSDESKGGKRERAWKVAERLCWEVLETNWPEGVDQVKDPMEGGGVVGWLLGRDKDFVDDSAMDRSAFPATLSVVNPPIYPHLYPHERFFRSFIQLLGYHSSPRSIPLVLAWMRYVDIKPTRHTLALAMLYVGELGLESRKLVRWAKWLEQWLGAQAVPDAEEIAYMRRGGGRAGRPIRR